MTTWLLPLAAAAALQFQPEPRESTSFGVCESSGRYTCYCRWAWDDDEVRGYVQCVDSPSECRDSDNGYVVCHLRP